MCTCCTIGQMNEIDIILLQSLQDPNDRTFTLPTTDIFPQGMANQHLPLLDPLPSHISFDLTSLWEHLDDAIGYYE